MQHYKSVLPRIVMSDSRSDDAAWASTLMLKHFAMNIHQRKASTALILCITVSTVVASLLVKSYFRQRAIDPRVTMEFGQGAPGKQASRRQTVVATTIDGEVARTAERIGEATALALSASI